MLRTKEERREAALQRAGERLRAAIQTRRTMKHKPDAGLEYYAEQNRQKQEAAQAILKWLDFSKSETFEPDDYEDPQHLMARMAYCAGFNDCRASLLKKVANFILESNECECTEDEECINCD